MTVLKILVDCWKIHKGVRKISIVISRFSWQFLNKLDAFRFLFGIFQIFSIHSIKYLKLSKMLELIFYWRFCHLLEFRKSYQVIADLSTMQGVINQLKHRPTSIFETGTNQFRTRGAHFLRLPALQRSITTGFSIKKQNGPVWYYRPILIHLLGALYSLDVSRAGTDDASFRWPDVPLAEINIVHFSHTRVHSVSSSK